MTVKTLFFAALLLPPLLRAAEPPEKPNVLIFFADDLGYADVLIDGPDGKPLTPNLDQLARSGLRCTSGYVTHPYCSPSRAGLLTGRQQQRFGHENNPVYDPLDEREGLPLTERLLPQFVKEAGYRTGWVGKWHLGASPAHTPWARGFDESFGVIGGGHRYRDWTPNGRQYTLPLTRNGKELPDVPEHLTTALGDEAAAFIKRNIAQPWLLYLAFNAPHTPHEPTAEREARFASVPDAGRRRYLAQVSLMDDAVGAALRALGDSGQTRRTLVFFLSDNGGGPNASNLPLRAMKGTLYEGGVRVPFLVSWPGKLPAAATYDPPVTSLDIFATALALAGVPVPADRPYDGVNLLPHLAGEVAAAPHERLFWRTMARNHAMREGNWKLVRMSGKPAELYDLSADLEETRDLAVEHPDITARMCATLDAWNKELINPVFPGSSVKNEDWGPGGANVPLAERVNPKPRVKPKGKGSKP